MIECASGGWVAAYVPRYYLFSNLTANVNVYIYVQPNYYAVRHGTACIADNRVRVRKREREMQQEKLCIALSFLHFLCASPSCVQHGNLSIPPCTWVSAIVVCDVEAWTADDDMYDTDDDVINLQFITLYNL